MATLYESKAFWKNTGTGQNPLWCTSQVHTHAHACTCTHTHTHTHSDIHLSRLVDSRLRMPHTPDQPRGPWSNIIILLISRMPWVLPMYVNIHVFFICKTVVLQITYFLSIFVLLNDGFKFKIQNLSDIIWRDSSFFWTNP